MTTHIDAEPGVGAAEPQTMAELLAEAAKRAPPCCSRCARGSSSKAPWRAWARTSCWWISAAGPPARSRCVTAALATSRQVTRSIRRLGADPWLRVGQDVVVGRDLDATITRLIPFGAFARVADGLEGLVHISELAPHGVATTKDAVQEGDRVRVRVVGVDPERRRLSLSIRQADASNELHPNV